MDRIKFYSTCDLSVAYYSHRIEDILMNLDLTKEYTFVDDILEFMNILKFRILDKNNTYFSRYKIQISYIQKQISIFLKSINENNFEQYLDEININYIEDFWELFAINLSKIIISKEFFLNLLNKNHHYIHYVLRHKSLVDLYDEEIKKFLISYDLSAELYLQEYEYKHDFNHKKFYFPKSITPKDVENIFLKYIEKTTHVGYLNVIAQMQNDRIVLSDELKLQAKRKAKEKTNSLFGESRGIQFGAEVSFQKQKEPVIISNSKGGLFVKYIYSEEWIENNLDYPTLFNNFIYLFEFVDRQFRLSFISKPTELGLFEGVLQGQTVKEYTKGIYFELKQMTALIQMTAYYNLLMRYEIYVEDLIDWFFSKYLKNEFSIDSYGITLPSKGTSALEKCRTIFPEIDGILKQFNLFVEHQKIDNDLLQISTNSIPISCYKSLIKKKYVYGCGDDFNRMCFCLFSNQSSLHYNEKYPKIGSFYNLIRDKNLKYDEFSEYNKVDLNWLIEKDIVYISNSYVKFKDEYLCIVLYDLYKNQVCSYHHMPQVLKDRLDFLVSNNYAKFESTLLTRQEADYFDYYLNDHKFSNGLNLRNKYLHASHASKDREDEHSRNYITGLYLLIILIIKINDDLCLADEIKSS